VTFKNLNNRIHRELHLTIVGDEPEALLLSVLFAEEGIPNYLVGPFREDVGSRGSGSAIEEALWLLGIHRRTGMISLKSDCSEIPLHDVRTLVFSSHLTGQRRTSDLEMRIHNVARNLAPGTNIAFAGLCRPSYTSTTLAPSIEKYSGLKIGSELALWYLPLFWSGESLNEFREKPKILSQYKAASSSNFQEELFRVFPTLSQASTVEQAEAAGLFAAVSREVVNALKLDLAKVSERHGIDFADVLNLCNGTETGLNIRSNGIAGRDTIGTSIALSTWPRREGSRLLRAAHTINDDYQAQVLRVIRGALTHCGQGLRRSRVAILGIEGLVKNSWSRPESAPLIEALSRKGVRISVYPGNEGDHDWSELLHGHAQIEHNLMRAVGGANCTVVALSRSAARELDASKLAVEMSRPGAICDLTRVLEASNVERVGLFYTSIGRGTLGT
jgi:UDP-N-acetyl-D-glucosamine/UDP-N-acetyl-D-galactosamine dehydrogenase